MQIAFLLVSWLALFPGTLVQTAAVHSSPADLSLRSEGGSVPVHLARCGIRTCSKNRRLLTTEGSHSRSLYNSTTVHRRALPSDLENKSQAQLAEWINKRVKSSDFSGNNLVMHDRSHTIDLVGIDKGEREFGIPTSRFAVPGDKPFAWTVNGMKGCVSLVIVKEQGKKKDDRGGVFVAHIWEQPGFASTVDHPRDEDIPEVYATTVDKDGTTHLLEEQEVMPALYEAWVTDFLNFGFPHANIPRLPKQGYNSLNFNQDIDNSPDDGMEGYDDMEDYDDMEGYANPEGYDDTEEHNDMEEDLSDLEPQTALASHVEALNGGKAYIIHPAQFIRNAQGEWVSTPNAAHTEYISRMKSTIKSMVRDIHFEPDFIYTPNRRDTQYEQEDVGSMCKIVFEYKPDVEGKKKGMLLIQDGGEQRTNPDGTRKKGPGGPFFYDFGRAGE